MLDGQQKFGMSTLEGLKGMSEEVHHTSKNDEEFGMILASYIVAMPDLISEIEKLNGIIDGLERVQESDTETIGLFADVVDELWGDRERAATHGYEGTIEKVRSMKEQIEDLSFTASEYKKTISGCKKFLKHQLYERKKSTVKISSVYNLLERHVKTGDGDGPDQESTTAGEEEG